MDQETVAEMAQEREEAIDRAMSRLGLPEEDEGAYLALGELYDDAFGSGQQMEYSHPS